MLHKLFLLLIVALLAGCASTKTEYLPAQQYMSRVVIELSDLHAKETYLSDGKAFLKYSEHKYDASGKEYWDTTLYWTYSSDLPEEFIRNNLSKK